MKRMALVLAAGEGTRMKSAIPKVLHRVCGRSMLSWVLGTLEELRDADLIHGVTVVIGNGADRVREEVGDRGVCVVQGERRGTGHAALVAAPHLDSGSAEEILVLTADSPLITAATLRRLCEVHRAEGAVVTMLGAMMEDPTGYGRVLRDASGAVMGIVEETEADPKQKRIREVNTSTYVFRWGDLREALPRLSDDNAKGEYFLTDAVGLLATGGGKVAAYVTPDPDEVLGVNSRAQLAEAQAIMRKRINNRWMEEGVTMEDPSTAYIDADVSIGVDTLLRPLVILEGATVVGRECRLGPNVRIADSRLGHGVTVEQATVRECELEDGVSVGPFASLRPGSVFRAGSKAGTFVETKKTVVGRGSKIPHLSYMGDASIGEDVNVGAGSITCNYDGRKKHPTIIEDGAFIGSDTMFIAPVRIGKGAVTGAGSAITVDVPDGALGVERGRQRNIEGYKRKAKEEGRS